MKDKHKGDSKQLLLVDDDPNLVLLVKDYLEFKGFEVITAENGREALEILEKEKPAMIICDVMMPEVDGYALVNQIRQDPEISWVPVMFLSAKSMSHDRVIGLNKGADVYMVKPFEPEELAAQVEATLKQASRLKEVANGTIESADRIVVPPNVELTPKESEVVNLVAKGMANREIAKQLNVSQRTVESHVSNMLNKTGLNNRTELARWAMQNKMA